MKVRFAAGPRIAHRGNGVPDGNGHARLHQQTLGAKMSQDNLKRATAQNHMIASPVDQVSLWDGHLWEALIACTTWPPQGANTGAP
jgi:hypothetical protein